MPAHEGLTNSFERINILGFAFAPSWVPVAVLSGSLISMVGIFATTRMVWQREVPVLGEDVDAGALKLLIDHWGLRFTTWVVLPTVADWVGRPEESLAATYAITLIGGSVALSLLGLGSFAQSMLGQGLHGKKR